MSSEFKPYTHWHDISPEAAAVLAAAGYGPDRLRYSQQKGTMKIKTSELTDIALRWTVAKCEGLGDEVDVPEELLDKM